MQRPDRWLWDWLTLTSTLSRIERRQIDMTTDLKALDAALAKLAEDVTAVGTAVTNLIAALPPGDFTTEVQAIKDATASLDTTITEATDALVPPAGPTDT